MKQRVLPILVLVLLAAAVATAGTSTRDRRGPSGLAAQPTEVIQIGPDTIIHPQEGANVQVTTAILSRAPKMASGINVIDQPDGTSLVLDQDGRFLTTIETGSGIVIANPEDAMTTDAAGPGGDGAAWNLSRGDANLRRITVTPAWTTPVRPQGSATFTNNGTTTIKHTYRDCAAPGVDCGECHEISVAPGATVTVTTPRVTEIDTCTVR